MKKLSFLWLFGHVACAGSPLDPHWWRVYGSTLPVRLRHSQTVFFKHFQTKEKQKWQPYFYKAGRHILQTPKNLGAWRSCRGDGARDEKRPPRTQRCVYHVKGMNDCLRRIAGLNSPASPPLKKTDTSYNNHALQKQHGNGQDAGSTQTAHRFKQNIACQCVKVQI